MWCVKVPVSGCPRKNNEHVSMLQHNRTGAPMSVGCYIKDDIERPMDTSFRTRYYVLPYYSNNRVLDPMGYQRLSCSCSNV